MIDDQLGKLKNKRVLLFQQRRWGKVIGHFLAGKLQGIGCRLGALTFKESANQFILSQTEVKYDFIMSNDEIIKDPGKYLAADSYSLAEICQDLDIDSVWPLVITLRNYARSYQKKYYYSFRQNVPDEQIIEFIKAMYKSAKEIFARFDPEVIIAPIFGDLRSIVIHLYAKKRNIEMITINDSKVKGVYIFSEAYKDDKSPFLDRIDELNAGQLVSKNIGLARKYIQEFRQSFKKPDDATEIAKRSSLIKKIRMELSPYYRIFLWYKRKRVNELPALGPTIDFRPPKIILRDFYTHRRNLKFINNFNYFPFDRLKKFAYLPLQVQPEATLEVYAPYFSNQIELARQIAMSLPDDYTLAVKEHPAMMGLRSPDYLTKIAETPNVKLIDYRIPSEEVLKRTDLILSPNSTTTSEAAYFCKPVIQFGDLGTTLKLPNVFKHTDMTTLSKKIKEVLKINLQTDDYERRLENFVAAAYDTGFEFNYIGIWERDELADLDVLWQALIKEMIRLKV